MNDASSFAYKPSCSDVTPLDLRGKSVELLDRAFEQPSEAVENEVDRVERVVVNLRDCLIERLRREPPSSGAFPLRQALDRVNVALSFIVAVEYPASGIHRKNLERAREVLVGIPVANLAES